MSLTTTGQVWCFDTEWLCSLASLWVINDFLDSLGFTWHFDDVQTKEKRPVCSEGMDTKLMRKPQSFKWMVAYRKDYFQIHFSIRSDHFKQIIIFNAPVCVIRVTQNIQRFLVLAVNVLRMKTIFTVYWFTMLEFKERFGCHGSHNRR